MNRSMLASAAVSLFTFGLHVFGGGPEFLDPMLGSQLSAAEKAVWAIVWHVISVAIFLNALFLAAAAFDPSRRVVLALYPLLVSLGFLVLFMAIGWLELGSVLILPQWTLFLVISVLALFGLRRSGVDKPA